MAKLAVTAGRVGSKYFRVRSNIWVAHYGIKVYELKARRKDGAYTWRLKSCHSIRTGKHPSLRLIKEAQACAEQMGASYISWLRAGVIETLSDLEKMSLDLEHRSETNE